jgi:hypothetical protein
MIKPMQEKLNIHTKVIGNRYSQDYKTTGCGLWQVKPYFKKCVRILDLWFSCA